MRGRRQEGALTPSLSLSLMTSRGAISLLVSWSTRGYRSSWRGNKTRRRVDAAPVSPGLVELHHALLEVIQGPFHEALILLVMRQQAVPKSLLTQHFRVSEDHNSVTCTGQRNVQTPWIVQESNPLVLVGANTRQDNVILFSALEAVHTCYLNLFIQLLLELPGSQHMGHDVCTLSLVRSDDSNLHGVHTRFEESRNNLLTRGSLGSIEVGGSTGADLFLSHLAVEHKRTVWLGPREVDVVLHTLVHGHPILQSSFIEAVRGELAEAGMHTVLHLEPCWFHSQLDQPLEERLCKPGPGCFLAHDHRPQLAMVAHKNHLLGTQHKWNEALCLCSLGRLVNQHLAESEV
mmetsp:Transcript_9120/g.10530  ORF Transcript_9120/g.10530 Transcript_9120/m.10530 type:complete len:347 (-) Transcript_9120:1219-2259(-)